MLKTLKNSWIFISHIGVNQKDVAKTLEEKKEIFFNQAIFVGFFGALSSTFSSIPFIGPIGYWVLLMNLSIIIGFFAHAQGYFGMAKRVVYYGVMLVGIFVNTIIGPDTLFHFGAINVCAFAIVIFDLKRDKIDLVLCVLLTVLGIIIAELRVGSPPDFTTHPDLAMARFMSLFSIIILTSIFVFFIIRLNSRSEIGLLELVNDKEQLIKSINNKTQELKSNNIELEDTIKTRTEKIQDQNRILEAQNSEKEMLLKEVHHRVKNNLQIIISLINLEISKFDSKKVEGALIETQNRVMSMSLVHKKMYQSANFSEIYLLDYCSQLMENIKHLGKTKSFTSSIEINDSIYLDVEKAIPFGLILNEIMTNFFKYAISSNDELHLHIRLIIDSDILVQLTVEDNGAGFPEKVLVGKSESFGIELIESLTEQLDGEFKISNNAGAKYELNFNL